MALVPMPILPGGSIHGLFGRMFYGTDTIPLGPDAFDNRPHAATAAHTALTKVPSGILLRANEIWRKSKRNTMTHSKHDYSPLATFDKQLGLAIATSFSNHLLRAHTKVTKWSQRGADPDDRPSDHPDTHDDTLDGDPDDDTYASWMEMDNDSVLSS